MYLCFTQIYILNYIYLHLGTAYISQVHVFKKRKLKTIGYLYGLNFKLLYLIPILLQYYLTVYYQTN